MESDQPGHSVAILGSTGSIGRAALDVVNQLGSPWRVAAVSAHSRAGELPEIAIATGAQYCITTCEESAQAVDWSTLPQDCRHLAGQDGLVEVAASDEVDTVVAAVVGAAGLESTLAAARAGKRLALANKEALVVAGSLMTDALRQSGGSMIPVDSEHSAIFQALRAGRGSDVQRVVLTASGGPFRTWSKSQIESAGIDDALAHPTWEMGRKITIDSATMMNKALEIIEARWLFDLPADKIDVVVHPQSIVHSMVEFADGSLIAQLSPPDMRLPIQYALTFPERTSCPAERMDFTKAWELSFEPADTQRFPALELGWEVARRGGTTGAVLSAANEAAVELFLNGKIKFVDIVKGCRRVLEEHNFSPAPTLDELMHLDRWARDETVRWAA